ncbi:50S ribosomal protein L10 [bacterium]|nr:50S ribosomal protein L10 [bacterium]
MERSKKQQIIEEIRDVLSKASSCVVISYDGVNMETFTPFRKDCANENVKLLVVKNTLAKIAVKGTDYEGISPFLTGMTALVISLGDQVCGAKIVKKVAKKNESIVVKCGVLDGKTLTAKEVEVLADLPSKEELQAKLLATMLAVPQNFVRLLNAVPETFVRLLGAYRDKLENQA